MQYRYIGNRNIARFEGEINIDIERSNIVDFDISRNQSELALMYTLSLRVTLVVEANRGSSVIQQFAARVTCPMV